MRDGAAAMTAAARLVVIGLAALSMAGCNSAPRPPQPGSASPARADLAQQRRDTAVALSAAPRAQRVAAVNRIDDNRLLDRIVRQAEDADVVNLACKRVTDQDLLFAYALTLDGRVSTCPFSAIESITDQGRLVRIAMEGQGRTRQISAVERIKDPAVLARIAREHPEPGMRQWMDHWLANKRTTALLARGKDTGDQAALYEVARHGATGMDRRVAAYRLTDPGYLARLALDNGVDTRVRASATNRLDDPVVLRRIVLETDSDSVRQAALKRITDPRELAVIARSGPPRGSVDAKTRAAAAGGVVDQGDLRAIAADDPDWTVRAEALRRVTDPATLARAARVGEPPWERLVATARVRDPVLLGELARGKGKQAHVAELAEALVEASAAGVPFDLAVTWSETRRRYMDPRSRRQAIVVGERMTLTITDPRTGRRHQKFFAAGLPHSIQIPSDDKDKRPYRFAAKVPRQDLVALLADHLGKAVPAATRSALARSARSSLLRAAAGAGR